MGLSAEQLERLGRLLDVALTLPTSEVERWRQSLPPQDADLQEALAAALAARGASNLPRLDRVMRPSGDDETAESCNIGDRVGPYLLIRQLGAGGMAQVWLAQRADGLIKRAVALKIPSQSRSRPDLTERFAREREILAGLEHPSIARLYDTGVTDQGLPYLVMEYVPGKWLTDWCDSHSLGVRQRVELFLQVLEAARYAHEKGVLHRDIKPSNVLVTEAGQVRLLDFGVARMLERSNNSLTQVYGKALSPAYASPEQFCDEELTAASDVYSLGVLLYELLTGRLPHAPKLTDNDTQVEPPVKPSTRLDEESARSRGDSLSRVARSIRGDLDAIVVKAMAADSSRRYPSASSFEDDLKRFLRNEAVQAVGRSIPYRAGKFLRRHPLAPALTALLVCALGAAGYALLERSAQPLAGVADEKSIAVLPFVDMSEHKDQEYFSDGLSEALIDSLARVPDLRVPARTSSFYFKGKSNDIVDIARQLRVSHVLEGSVRKAGSTIRVTVQLIRADNGFHVWSQTYERGFNDVFKVEDDIVAGVVNSLKVSMLADAKPAVGATANFDAYNLFLQGRFANSRASEAEVLSAVAFYERSLQLDPDFAAAWAALGRAQQWLAGISENSDPSARAALAREAAKRALALDPQSSEAHLVLARNAIDFEYDARVAEAEVEAAERIAPNDPLTLAERGILSIHRGDPDLGARKLQAALERDPFQLTFWRNFSLALDAQGRYAEAERAIRRNLTENPAAAGSLLMLERILLHEGALKDALLVAENAPDDVRGCMARAIAYHHVGRDAEASEQMLRLINQGAQNSAYQVAEVYADWGRRDDALAWLERAFRQHDAGFWSAKVDPYLRALKEEPRFVALLKATGAND
jgi:eukaryotic-like serine/threonine-protein kinase